MKSFVPKLSSIFKKHSIIYKKKKNIYIHNSIYKLSNPTFLLYHNRSYLKTKIWNNHYIYRYLFTHSSHRKIYSLYLRMKDILNINEIEEDINSLILSFNRHQFHKSINYNPLIMHSLSSYHYRYGLSLFIFIILLSYLLYHYDYDHLAHAIDMESLDNHSSNSIESPTSNNSDYNHRISTDFSLFWQLIKDEWFVFLLSIISCFGSSFLENIITRMGGQLLDIAGKGDFDQFTSKSLKLLSYIIIQGILHSIYYSLLSYGSENIKARLQCMIFDHFIYQDREFFDKNNIGEIMSNITTDVDDIRYLIKNTISLGVRSLMSFLTSIIAASYQSPKLTALVFAFVGSAVGIGSIYARFLKKLSKSYKDAQSKSVMVASESMSSSSTVQSFANEEREISKYSNIIKESSYKSKLFGISYAIFQGISKIGISGILFGALIYGGKLVVDNELSVGDLSSFIIISYNIQQSLGHISQLSGNISNGIDSIERVMNILNINPTINRSNKGKIIPNLKGDIKFENVSFSYPTRPNHMVLNDISIDLKNGKTLSLVGYSGSGKSTISKLILRFYDVLSGSIKIDGIDIKEIDPHWLRSQIGIVDQEPVLFRGTILENIAYGNPNSSMEEIKRACEISNCDEFIRRLPNGYQTVVGDRGTQLSGGQKQRVAIARAILKNPKILILDEATSALDSKSEHYLQQSLSYLMKGRTTIIIAHRLSTVKNSDEILVLNNGVLVERGTHDELMSHDSHYATMFKQQTFKD